jgi:hypothetical protein
MDLMNCWEVTNCGKQEDCPAYPNHGRACFAVTGTLCRGEKQPSYDAKIGKCRELCVFYKQIMGTDTGDRVDIKNDHSKSNPPQM